MGLLPQREVVGVQEDRRTGTYTGTYTGTGTNQQ
jgi:hypothetical protein